jgi:hypothetical protein
MLTWKDSTIEGCIALHSKVLVITANSTIALLTAAHLTDFKIAALHANTGTVWQ